jgi:glycerol uptake facilitator-like aquaporin
VAVAVARTMPTRAALLSVVVQAAGEATAVVAVISLATNVATVARKGTGPESARRRNNMNRQRWMMRVTPPY